jgi:putative Holliday junction resolvase
MARIVSIDYGTKRTGLAATDPLQIIVTGLDTLPTDKVLDFLQRYCTAEEVEKFVVGEPMHEDGNPSQIAHLVVGFVRKLNKLFPDIPIVMHDERFTSREAKRIILESGAKKKKRQDKSLVDKISAVLILQDYLGHLE